MAQVRLLSTRSRFQSVAEVDTAQVTNVHALNNGLTINMADGKSVGVKLKDGPETFKTLAKLMTAVVRAQGLEKARDIPVVIEEQNILRGDDGKSGVNKMAKIHTTGYDFVSK